MVFPSFRTRVNGHGRPGLASRAAGGVPLSRSGYGLDAAFREAGEAAAAASPIAVMTSRIAVW